MQTESIKPFLHHCQTHRFWFQAPPIIVIQLYWREFFFTMSINNPNYSQMLDNKICINIPWYPSVGNPNLEAFNAGLTGFPFIDAGVRQLKREGWIHHILRNSLACFLTRGWNIINIILLCGCYADI